MGKNAYKGMKKYCIFRTCHIIIIDFYLELTLLIIIKMNYKGLKSKGNRLGNIKKMATFVDN